MPRPIGDIDYLEELVSEFIYYAQDKPPSDVRVTANLLADEHTEIFRIADVRTVLARYFSGEHYEKVLYVINHVAGEYGWKNGFIPEEVLFDGQGAIPYHLGVLPYARRIELDKMQEEY
jgi:hypothetical protein